MITVIGGRGFVGSRLVSRLTEEGRAVQAPGREEPLSSSALGTVIYAAGVTSDFRTRPLDTVEAHVVALARLLRDADVDRLVYLSSTRVYRTSASTSEGAALTFEADDPEALYDVTKLTGELTALSAPVPEVRIARLSNVYGPAADTASFLASLIRDALRDGRLVLRTDLRSEKDYISLDDVTDVLLWLADGGGTQQVYNVAAGRNRTHGEIAAALEALAGCSVAVTPGAPLHRPLPIETSLLRAEFPGPFRDVLDDLPTLVSAFAG